MGIRFTSNSGARSDAMVYSLDGALISVLATRASAPGMREVRWDGRSGDASPVPPGTYVFRIRAGDETAALKVVRLE